MVLLPPATRWKGHPKAQVAGNQSGVIRYLMARTEDHERPRFLTVGVCRFAFGNKVAEETATDT